MNPGAPPIDLPRAPSRFHSGSRCGDRGTEVVDVHCSLVIPVGQIHYGCPSVHSTVWLSVAVVGCETVERFRVASQLEAKFE